MAQPQTHTRTRRSRIGGREVVTRGLAAGVFQDLFHYLMTVSWPRLFVAVAGFNEGSDAGQASHNPNRQAGAMKLYRLGWLGALLLPVATLAADALYEGFANPPDSARPRAWWHWMNGNVTQDGIAKDLDWMKRIGLGGVQNFDVNLATPQIVSQRLVYMTSPWKDAFRFAVQRADELGLEFAIAASPGWSETGGPWVPAQDGLKKVVWSETLVNGGQPLSLQLPAPPVVSGPFLDIPVVDELAALQGGQHWQPPTYYRDIAVLAVPVNDPPDEQPQMSLDQSQSPAVIQLRYSAAQTVRTATLYIEGAAPMFGDRKYSPVLQAQIDGRWQDISPIELMSSPTTVSFAPVTAQQFRVVLHPYAGPPRRSLGEGMSGLAGGPAPLVAAAAPAINIGVMRLGSQPQIHRYETKAGFSIAPDYYALAAPTGADGQGVSLAQVHNITLAMRPDGRLDWTPPPGRWRILRLGYSLLGTSNHPAPLEATGLEVDKFDAAAVRRYLQTYLRNYRDTVGAAQFGKRGLRALLTDSIEVGAANWTPQFISQFERLRGYDPLPWLPTLTGVIIESRARSDAFLYDYRRTLADLVASEHYGTVAAVALENGLSLYGEALEDHRPSLGDDMAMRSHADTPMAALWSWNRGFEPRPTFLGDMKGASSVAHVYGRSFAAAESMTSLNSPWAFAPSDLRRIIDLEFAYGINRPVIHTSVHQPVDDKVPGLSLSIFGQYFNRHEAWAELARPWIDYIARNSYLLQQGRNVADVAYFYGEEQPLTSLYADAPLADVPRSHAFDFVNALVLQQLRVEQGQVVTGAGARYRLLYLGGSSRQMTLATLQHIAALARAGATIAGRAPTGSPALGDDPVVFARLVRQLWSGAPQTVVGNGRVLDAPSVVEALSRAGVASDFELVQAASDARVLFVHRQLADGELYFINNRQNRPETLAARFRVSGRQPEIWHADTGAIEPVTWRADGDQTVVNLNLAPEDSFFVVFRKATTLKAGTATTATPVVLANLDEGWDLGFQTVRGAPASAHMAKLEPLNEHAEAGIRYFSGIVSYTRRFEVPAAQVGKALQLDLGRVGDVAEVSLNGKVVGTVWHAPYVLDLGTAVQAGHNLLQVRVANLWVNRLIGDAQPGAARVTYTAMPTYGPQAALRPSGLMGPVRVLTVGR